MPFPDSDFTLGAWEEVTSGLYLAVAEPDSVNLGLVVGAEGCVVVDTGSSPAQGRGVQSSVSTVTDRPILAVVATHWHHDHAFGLAGFDGLTTIAHESVSERLAGPEAADLARSFDFSPAELARPVREVVVATAVDLGGGRRVEIAQLGRGHTEGDLVVVVPDADVVFAGDLIETAGAPWYGPDSWPHEWAATLDGLVGLMTASTRAIPGHGRPADLEFVFEARGRVAAVSGEIRRLAESGVSLTDAPDRGDWAYPIDHVAEGLAPGYAQLDVRRQLPLA